MSMGNSCPSASNKDKNMKVRVFPLINPFCHRMVYFVLPIDYDVKQMSIEQIYEDSLIAEFDRKVSVRYAIKHNMHDND